MEIKNALVNLLKVKTIVTLIVIGVFAVLALRGDITSDNVLTITASVISFYFGTQHERKSAAANTVNTETVAEVQE